MKFTVVTLFPELVENFCREGLLSSAIKKGVVSFATVNPRAFTMDIHHTVDDRAFGGSDGMVMKPEPLAAAVESVLAQGSSAKVVVLSPQGRRWNQSLAREWAASKQDVILVSGRYAGIDQRFNDEYADDEISIGDFVLNGGEVAALAIMESVARLLPGVLGNAASMVHDSFTEPRLEAPQFTRPREWRGRGVPEILLSGDHAQIDQTLKAVSVIRTALLRPDLLDLPMTDLQASARFLLTLSDGDLKAFGFSRSDVELLSVSE